MEESRAAAEGTMGAFPPPPECGSTGRVGGCGGPGNREESVSRELVRGLWAPTPLFLQAGVSNKPAFVSLA